jgi:hypothetical protein
MIRFIRKIFARKKAAPINELLGELNELIEAQIRKLPELTSTTITEKIRYSLLPNEVLASLIAGRANEAFVDLRPHSDYYSVPKGEFGICLTVVPGLLEEARTYYLNLYPSFGFAGFMLETVGDKLNTTLQVEKNFRGKKGILFVVACISPKNKRKYLNFGLLPISKEFSKLVPFISPQELVGDDINEKIARGFAQEEKAKLEKPAPGFTPKDFLVKNWCPKCRSTPATPALLTGAEQKRLKAGLCPRCEAKLINMSQVSDLKRNY